MQSANSGQLWLYTLSLTLAIRARGLRWGFGHLFWNHLSLYICFYVILPEANYFRLSPTRGERTNRGYRGWIPCTFCLNGKSISTAVSTVRRNDNGGFLPGKLGVAPHSAKELRLWRTLRLNASSISLRLNGTDQDRLKYI